MASGFKPAITGEKKDFNNLNIEDKKLFIEEHGWFDNDGPNRDVVVHFEISCFINEKLEAKHEYFEKLIYPLPNTQNPQANIPATPVHIYYDNGVKIRTRECSYETRKEETKDYTLSIDEPVEFSTHEYAPFEEKYQIVLKDVRFGDMLDL